MLLVIDFCSRPKLTKLSNREKVCLPTGRLIVGRDAPAQASKPSAGSLFFGWSIWTAGFEGAA